MSVLPEFILQTTLVRGIRRLRNDSRLIDQLFRNLDQKQLQQLRHFIKTQAFDLCLNYPRAPLKIPAIVIILKDDQEEQAFLGDSMGIDVPDELSWEGPEEGTLGGVASVATLAGNPKMVFGPYYAQTGTKNTLTIPRREWVTDQYLVKEHKVRIILGKGAGQIRTITANSSTGLMVSPDWLTVPDTTSLFEITTDIEETLGEPSSLYDRNNPPDFLERKGGLYNVTYQLQVFAPNPELAVYLATMVKAIFTSFRTFLEGQGVINLSMRGSDFTPRPDYQPDMAYLRQMNLNFIYPFDTFEPLGDLAKSFRIVLEGEPLPGSPIIDPIYSDTTWAIDGNVVGGGVVDDLKNSQRIYWGSASAPLTFSAEFVQDVLISNGGSMITNTRKHEVTYFNGPGQQMYYAIPHRFGGAANYFINQKTGVAEPFTVVSSLTLKTAFGTELYDVWASSNAATGFVTIAVQ